MLIRVITENIYIVCNFVAKLSNTQFWPYSGGYKHQFTRPGIYYYWSGPVDSTGIIVMRGKVNVTETFSQIENVTVRVGEYEAVYNLTSGRTFTARGHDVDYKITKHFVTIT